MDNSVIQVEAERYQSILEERIKKFAKAKPIDISDLAARSDLSESSFYKMFKSGTARLKSLEKIAAVLEIDIRELLPNVEPEYSQSKAVILTKEIAKSQRLGNAPVNDLQLYFSEIPEKDAELYIPYYDVEITAGRLEQFFDDAEEVPEGYIYAPQYRGCIACNVKGDSMYDRIFPGSRLYVYYLKNKKYIDFGHIYMVVLDGYRLLKYIDPDPKDESRVILRSHNRDQYKDWPVEKADILHLFLVKGYENQNAN